MPQAAPSTTIRIDADADASHLVLRHLRSELGGAQDVQVYHFREKFATDLTLLCQGAYVEQVKCTLADGRKVQHPYGSLRDDCILPSFGKTAQLDLVTPPDRP
jgi:hypothetical protein